MTSTIPAGAARLRLHDADPCPFTHQAVHGFTQPVGQKFIPTPYVYERAGVALRSEETQYFLDEVGSRDVRNGRILSGADIFSRIEEHADYYVGRAEEGLLSRRELKLLRSGDVVTEFGPGNGRKSLRFLQENGNACGATYQAIDVSEDFLDMAVREVKGAGVQRTRTCCDDFFTSAHGFTRADVALFFGTTISNFDPPLAISLLRHMRASYLKNDGVLLLGQDGNQDAETLQRCYDDSGKHTATFVMNALRQVRRDHAPEMFLHDFAYKAYFDRDEQTMRMGIVSKANRIVCVDGVAVQFAKDEFIRVGQSRKYPTHAIKAMAAEAGYITRGVVSSPEGMNIHILKPEGLRHG